MRALILLLALTACAPTYAYKPGTQASLDNKRLDHNACEDQAFKVYDASNHTPAFPAIVPVPIGFGIASSVAMSLGGFVATNAASQATAERSKHGPVLTPNDIGPMIEKCMASKGYIEKP